MTESINALVAKYSYKKLPKKLSEEMRLIYANDPHTQLLKHCTAQTLYNLKGEALLNGFDRIVIGDYGAYIEFSKHHLITPGNIVVPKSQSFRLTPEFRNNVKYLWLTDVTCRSTKIYLQQRTVSYADYVPGKFYIAPSELSIAKLSA